MAWIQVDQALPTHRKTLKLADALDISTTHAVGLMVTLWLWSLDNAPNGSLDDIPPRTLARILQWDGDCEELMNAMRGAGFIDSDEIHDWQEYTGRLLDQRAAAKERMRKRRASIPQSDKQSEHVVDTLREPFANVTRTEPEQCAHVLSKTTVQNTTQNNSTKEYSPTPQEGEAPEKSPEVPFEKIMQLFNEICESFPTVMKIEGQRRKAVAARWKTYKDLQTFETLFKTAETSSFLKGENDRNWCASFDWMMKANNFVKILEGTYDDKGGKRHETSNQKPATYKTDEEMRKSGWHTADDDE